jgi:hypothetical protein
MVYFPEALPAQHAGTPRAKKQQQFFKVRGLHEKITPCKGR